MIVARARRVALLAIPLWTRVTCCDASQTQMPHWETYRDAPKKTFTQYSWTSTVLDGLALLEDRSDLLDENGKSKVWCCACSCVAAACGRVARVHLLVIDIASIGMDGAVAAQLYDPKEHVPLYSSFSADRVFRPPSRLEPAKQSASDVRVRIGSAAWAMG